MPSVISGDANVSATEFGFLDGVTSSLQTQIDAKLPLAGGKILQIVRATDSTNRTTTSTSFVDATGMSVTITPQKSDSAILVLSTFAHISQNGVNNLLYAYVTLTDSSNNELVGTEGGASIGTNNFTGTGTEVVTDYVVLVGYSTPATTSAVTYKMRHRSADANNTSYINNAARTGQMYAIEVSA